MLIVLIVLSAIIAKLTQKIIVFLSLNSWQFPGFMSLPMKWGNILFLAPLSVYLSVRLSVRHAFVLFTNNFAQM